MHAVIKAKGGLMQYYRVRLFFFSSQAVYVHMLELHVICSLPSLSCSTGRVTGMTCDISPFLRCCVVDAYVILQWHINTIKCVLKSPPQKNSLECWDVYLLELQNSDCCIYRLYRIHTSFTLDATLDKTGN